MKTLEQALKASDIENSVPMYISMTEGSTCFTEAGHRNPRYKN